MLAGSNFIQMIKAKGSGRAMTMDQSVKSELGTVDIQKLLEFLPHRYPFLLVDRIIECDEDNSCIGIKNVTINEPQFQGHFPGKPIMPGVLLVEGMAQTAGALCVQASASQRPHLVYFMTIDKVKFRKPVVPGDRVEFHMKKLSRRRNMWWYRGEARVDGQVVCEAELGAMLVSDPQGGKE
jgi:3-hydroxyacyl-[acyl-carrier-protein] dehydratase